MAKANLKDIAKASNVSTTAVSLVLNNKPNRLSEQTRELILRTAKELDYQPNTVARSLATGKTHTIGLIVPDISNQFFATMAKEIEQQANKLNYSVILANNNDYAKSDIEYVRSLINRNVDGILLVRSSSGWNETLEKELTTLMSNYKRPLIALDRSIKNLSCCLYESDNALGGYLVCKHLLALGHRRIGFLTGPKNLNSTTERLAGCKKALEEYGETFDPLSVFEGNYDTNSGINGFPYLMRKKVSAIFAFNDMMALGVFKSARQMNIRIPQELSLAGFDNIIFSELTEVPLTTVQQPVEAMSRDATVHLISMTEKSFFDTEKTLTYQPTLIIRNSTKQHEGH